MLGTRFILLPLVISLWNGTANAESVRIGAHTFTLPDGFEIEVAAGPPLVNRPIVMDFDEAGRLYVAESSGSNDKVEKQLAERPHSILRLEDTDGDGKFDRKTVFADKMMFPEGTLWHDGSLYVAAPPSIWKLKDTNGDGVADVRTEWFQGKTLTGCANDLHGPYLGPDGRIYWCKGAFAKQTYERPGKKPFETKASHIFRARPDGSEIEPVMTGGMDNPVDTTFTATGERIFTTTFLQHPGGGRRDGLIHAVYGGVYGKFHEVIEGHARTGEIMPVLAHLGPAAPCGLTTYESAVFGQDFRGNLFACSFNLHKVTRHALSDDGATFASKDSDFLASDNFDFHPTDVQEDADGSLLVADTGGWYKLCCPTSQLWKPDILGAIYRIRKVGSKPVADPRGLALDWKSLSVEMLAERLGDNRPAVRKRAMAELAKLGEPNVAALDALIKTSESAEARRNAVWTLARIDGAAARKAVRLALADNDATVRHAAVHAVSVHRDREALSSLIQLVKAGPAPVRRAAAEAIGRLGDKSAVPALLAAAGDDHGRVYEHSMVYALIEIAHPTGTAKGLSASNPRVQRAALIAIDQMEGGGLDPNHVAKLLGSSEPILKETAAWIVGRRPEWGKPLSGYLAGRLAEELDAQAQQQLERQLAQFAKTAEVRAMLADGLDGTASNPDKATTILRAMAGAELKELPREWVAPLIAALTSKQPALIAEAVRVARAIPPPKEQAKDVAMALTAAAHTEQLSPRSRLEALAAVPSGLAAVGPDVFNLLGASLAAENEVPVRSLAAEVIAKARLSHVQLLVLAGLVKSAGPLEMNRLLEAFEKTADEKIGLALLESLHESAPAAGLRADSLRAKLAKYPETVRKQAEALFAVLDADAAKRRQELDHLLSVAHTGDIRRGQSVFNSTKAACASCHAIGYVGGVIGPDLTRVGQIRTERDLLEAIVFPNNSFVQSYEPVVVATTEGRIVSGVVRRNSPDEIVLAVSATEEARIPTAEIETMRPGTVSIMPSGLDKQLTQQDLIDLLAFLKANK